MSTPPIAPGALFPPQSLDAFQTTPPGPRVSFAFAGISPPSGVYVARDDILMLRVSLSIATATTVRLTTRLLRPDGIITSRVDLVAASAAGTTTFSFQMAEGFLLSCMVQSVTGLNLRGQVFCEVFLNRSDSLGAAAAALLIQDYVTLRSDAAWPGGAISKSADGVGALRSITGTTPAAGAEISETVPGVARWVLQSFKFRLATSAVVANRFPSLIIDDGTTNLWQLYANQSTPASNNNTYYWSNVTLLTANQNNVNNCPLPSGFILRPGYRIRTSTLSIDAGDQYALLQYSVQEWVDS